jgi:NADPH-dependent F420 reductase
MRVAMIGSGSVGKALGGRLIQAGHEVIFTAAHSENAEAAAAELGGSSSPTNAGAAEQAEVVILAVPFSVGETVAGEIRANVHDKVVIDVTNPLTSDLSGTATEPESAAEVFQRWLPDAHLAKAFNYAFASRMALPQADGAPLEGFVAADDADAKATAMTIVQAVGFEPVDAGPLGRARQLEALALLNIGLQVVNGWGWTSAWRLVR